jgi:CRISPR associated protein Cas1
VLDRLAAARKSADGATALAQLLGIEGDAASVYFRAFAGLLKSPEDKQSASELAPFRFEARNRRPPTDPVNAMLSLAYAMLTRHLTITLASVGLDPYRGFYHAPRYGRPALALDLMEPFRAVIAGDRHGHEPPVRGGHGRGCWVFFPHGSRRHPGWDARLCHESGLEQFVGSVITLALSRPLAR